MPEAVMGASLSIYADPSMVLEYSSGGSFSRPIVFGSLESPLNGISGGTSAAVPIWVKNTGTEKLYGITAVAADGSSSAAPGEPSSTADAFICLANDSSPSPSVPVPPPSPAYNRAPTSLESANLVILGVVTASGARKAVTGLGRDDDSRTMLPGEYAIVWLKSEIDSARSPGGTLPAPAGIKNIRMRFNAFSSTSSVKSSLGIPATVLVLVYMYSTLEGKTYVETLVSKWKFDETSGTVANDEQGRHPGQLHGCVWWPVGLERGSLNVVGASYVDFGNDISFNPGMHSFTIEAAFKSPDLGTGGPVLSKMGFGGGFAIRLNPTGTVSLRIADASTTIMVSGGEYLNDSGWHYLACIVNRTTNRLTFICDKEVFGDIDISAITGNISNSEKMMIGDLGSSFTGRVDEIAFYNRALSIEELNANYDMLWNAYVSTYGVTDDGELVTDNNGRVVVDEVL